MTWPQPQTTGQRTLDAFAPWIIYHYPYTDAEAAQLGCAVIDATCATCGITQRITIAMGVDPADDEIPPSGISAERSAFTMDHLHGRKVSR